MSKAVYQWRPRATFSIDAQVAGEELAKIKGHNSGDLTAEMVVKAAEDKKSPLHSVFEWDDAKAAAQQRLHVAGQLIKSVVVIVTSDGQTDAKPVSVSVTSTPTTGGNAAARVVSEAELHVQRVERGWGDLSKWTGTYGGLPEFAQIAAVIKALIPAKESKAA